MTTETSRGHIERLPERNRGRVIAFRSAVLSLILCLLSATGALALDSPVTELGDRADGDWIDALPARPDGSRIVLVSRGDQRDSGWSMCTSPGPREVRLVDSSGETVQVLSSAERPAAQLVGQSGDGNVVVWRTTAPAGAPPTRAIIARATFSEGVASVESIRVPTTLSLGAARLVVSERGTVTLIAQGTPNSKSWANNPCRNSGNAPTVIHRLPATSATFLPRTLKANGAPGNGGLSDSGGSACLSPGWPKQKIVIVIPASRESLVVYRPRIVKGFATVGLSPSCLVNEKGVAVFGYSQWARSAPARYINTLTRILPNGKSVVRGVRTSGLSDPQFYPRLSSTGQLAPFYWSSMGKGYKDPFTMVWAGAGKPLPTPFKFSPSTSPSGGLMCEAGRCFDLLHRRTIRIPRPASSGGVAVLTDRLVVTNSTEGRVDPKTGTWVGDDGALFDIGTRTTSSIGFGVIAPHDPALFLSRGATQKPAAWRANY